MKMKTEIEIDLYVDVEPEGLTRSLYLGDACEPTFTAVESWEEMIERNLEYFIVPGSGKIRPGDAEEINKIIVGMEGAVALFKKRLEEMADVN